MSVAAAESSGALTNAGDELSNELQQFIWKARRDGLSVCGLDAAGPRTSNTTAST